MPMLYQLCYYFDFDIDFGWILGIILLYLMRDIIIFIFLFYFERLDYI